VDSLYDELSRISEVFPEKPVFELFQTYFGKIETKDEEGKEVMKEVCPTGIADVEWNYVIEMENKMREYHVAPFAGGLLDQPMLFLEVSDVIMETRAKYMKRKQQEIQDKIKKSPGSKTLQHRGAVHGTRPR